MNLKNWHFFNTISYVEVWLTTNRNTFVSKWTCFIISMICLIIKLIKQESL